MRTLEAARSIANYVVGIRRQIHRNPELSFQEYETTDLIVAELEALGLEVTCWDDITGAVGLLRGSRPGPTIALRADIDALPVQERTGTPYASQNDGVMHACAHDAHTAIVLGVARLLAERTDFAGNVKFIFQPAEEKPPGGAITLVEKGVLEDPRVDALFALHHATELQAGEIGVRCGPLLACADAFTLTVKCKGGGGSAPHKGVDGITVAAEIITALHVMMTRRIDPIKNAVLSFGTVQAGTAFNILADEVVMTGTCRALDVEVARSFPRLIEEVASGIAATYGGTIELDYHVGYPPVVNDERQTAVLERAARRVLGDDCVKVATPLMAGDDLAYFLQVVPGSYFWLGIANPEEGIVNPAHTALFDIDESALVTGVAVLLATVDEAIGELS